jgi:hypothetical protein
MGNNARDAIWAGATFVLTAAAISLVVYLVVIGNSYKNEFANKVDKMQIEMDSAALRDLNDSSTEMSMSTVYNIVNTNSSSIGTITCKMNNLHSDNKEHKYTADEKTCIGSHLTGRCKVSIEYDPSTSLYNIVIEPID